MISFIYNERKQCENKSKTKRNFTEVSLQMISRTFFWWNIAIGFKPSIVSKNDGYETITHTQIWTSTLIVGSQVSKTLNINYYEIFFFFFRLGWIDVMCHVCNEYCCWWWWSSFSRLFVWFWWPNKAISETEKNKT